MVATRRGAQKALTGFRTAGVFPNLPKRVHFVSGPRAVTDRWGQRLNASEATDSVLRLGLGLRCAREVHLPDAGAGTIHGPEGSCVSKSGGAGTQVRSLSPRFAIQAAAGHPVPGRFWGAVAARLGDLHRMGQSVHRSRVRGNQRRHAHGGSGGRLDALAGYLRQHSVEFNIDSGRIAVYAASGNACRGLPFIEDPKRNWIQAAAIYHGAADIAHFRREVPLLFVRAGLDRPQMNRLIDEATSKAIRQNVTIAVVNFAAGHHGFEVIDDNDAGRDVIEQTFQFFKKSLDPSWRAAFTSGQHQAEAAGAVSSGDYERAAAIYGRLVDENSGATIRLAYGEALLGAKRYRDARSQFDRASQLGGLGARDLGVPAAMASALDGDEDAAIRWLKTIPKQYLPAGLQQNAAFETLRTRPDFQALFQN